MGILDNPRHEAFAQALSLGKTADAAYTTAGFKANRGNAARMKANDDITKRVAELQQQLAAEHAVTRDRLAAQLAEDREFARQMGQASVAVSATMGLAKLFGFLADRHEDRQRHLNVVVPTPRCPRPSRPERSASSSTAQ